MSKIQIEVQKESPCTCFFPISHSQAECDSSNSLYIDKTKEALDPLKTHHLKADYQNEQIKCNS